MKKKFLKFIEEKGIAKKLLNCLERNGNVEISVIALRIIGIMLILSLILNFCFITKIGIAIQQGIIFIVKVFNGIVSNIVYTLAYYDSRSPGTLSMLGTIINSCIGFFAVMAVFFFQTTGVKKREIKNLMCLLTSTYRAVNIFSITGATEELKNLTTKDFVNSYNQIIYDKDWGKYLSNIKKYEEIEDIKTWFYLIEQCYYLDDKKLKIMNEKLEKIIKKYGFGKELIKIKLELKKRQQKENTKKETAS